MTSCKRCGREVECKLRIRKGREEPHYYDPDGRDHDLSCPASRKASKPALTNNEARRLLGAL